MEPRGAELIERYKDNAHMPPEAEITEQMILRHWNLERDLAIELLESTPETRWEVFEQCYSRFYGELTWLNLYTGKAETKSPAERYGDWLEAIDGPPKRIYEVGSGEGEMISYLAEIGFDCRASEITRERGQQKVSTKFPNLTWGKSDGVHLDRFEPKNTYDVVLSDQVIEHLHPEDVIPHFKSVFTILATGGIYVFNTPHRYTGPYDISRVFKCDEPKGMHLHEYTYRELARVAMETGFSEVYYVIGYRLRQIAAKLGIAGTSQMVRIGTINLKIILLTERILQAVPKHRWRRFCGELLKKAKLFKDDIFLAARK